MFDIITKSAVFQNAMKTMCSAIHCSLVILLLALASGCTSVNVSDLSTQDIPQGGVSQSRDGLSVRAVPLTERSEIRSRFGTDLLSRGILPVFVEFNNRNPTDSFIVSPEKCGLNFGAEPAHQTAQGPRSLRGAEGMAVASAVAGSAALYVAAAITATSAETANHQFIVNQLEAKTLSSGGHDAGYLYFHIPGQARGACSLVIAAQRAGGDSTATFNIPLNLNPKQMK